LADSALQQNRKVLFLVDDDAVLGEITKSILDLSPFKVRFFSSPVVALKAAQEEQIKPAILVSDFNMPELNGLDLINECRKACPGIKCVLLSGTVRLEELKRHSIKADAFLAKPFMAAQLLETVRQLSE
jgi:DNA-binding NtrC family response regulator